MPIYSCGGGKYRIGEGECIYTSYDNALSAYQAYLAQKKMGYNKKTYNLKALDVDAKTKSVKVAISQLGSLDRDGDVIAQNAFNRTIKAKGPEGTNEIWHLIDHGRRIADSALSKFKEIGLDGDYLYGVSEYRDTWLWREVAWPLYKAGDINQHSIGFNVIQQEVQKDGINVIKEVELYEGSAVLWGANPNTPVMEIAKGLFEEKKESLEDRIKYIIKAVKDGKYEGEKGLLQLEFLNLASIYKSTWETNQEVTPEVAQDDLGTLINNTLTKWKIEKLLKH